ncbi:MAG: DUF72 domain-containing protein [Verrucomicrobia bacterium]|nr:DUF72 domain-containing protein [Verrucomicrobiota bacterium]
MSSNQQLNLPGGGERRAPPFDTLAARVRGWAERGVFFGTSSWKYEGWLGQVYSSERYATRGRFSKPRFERECLAEYAETFPTVCGDFSFYSFYSPQFWERLFAQVPATFQFGFKAPEMITAPRFADLERYGMKAGQPNEHFLDPALLKSDFLDRLAPHRGQVGYVAFEFPQFHRATPTGNAEFLEKLDGFLGELPDTFRYGVEVRTESLLGPDYFACLRRHRVAHVFNSWTRMPAVGGQLKFADAFTAGFIVVRALLRPGRAYEEAVRMFQPYSEVRDPYPEGVRDVAGVVRAAIERSPKAKAFVAVNNRFVGNAPTAISQVLDELDRLEKLPPRA